MKPAAILFIILYFFTQAPAQPRLSVEIKPVNPVQGTPVTLSYMIEGAREVTQFVPPKFTDMMLVQGPNQTQGYTLVDGERKYHVNFIYILRPLRAGNISIPDATVKADGFLLHSGMLTVEVGTSDVSRPDPSKGNASDLLDQVLRKGESIRMKVKDAIFVSLELSRHSCRVGEPIVAAYKLYTRINSESKVIRRPSFNGFSVYDMVPPESDVLSREKVNGRLYNVYLLRKVQLYPLQPGVFDLESMEVENAVSFLKDDAVPGGSLSDLLNAYSGSGLTNAIVKEKIMVSNASEKITVKALPVPGNDTFSGAVGAFHLETEIKPKDIRLGEVGYVEIRISGSGNLPMIGIPKISWPASVEPFEDSIREEYDLLRSPIRGVKTFTIPFSSKRAGNFIFPGVRWNYFDIDSGRYRTLQSTPIPQVVLPSESRKKSVQETGDALISKNDRIWLLLPIALIMGLLALFMVQQVRTRNKRRRSLEKNQGFHSEVVGNASLEGSVPINLDLEQARILAGRQDGMGFYKESERVLMNWLHERHGLDFSSRNMEIRKTLMDAGKGRVLTEELIRYLQDCEIARFDPLQDWKRLPEDLERFQSIVEALMNAY